MMSDTHWHSKPYGRYAITAFLISILLQCIQIRCFALEGYKTQSFNKISKLGCNLKYSSPTEAIASLYLDKVATDIPSFILELNHERYVSEGFQLIGEARWKDTIDANVETDAVSDYYKAYGAGLLEGFVTHKRIRDFFLNTLRLPSRTDEPRSILRSTITKSVDFIKSLAPWNETSPLDSLEATDPMVQQARLNTFQILGMNDGYEVAKQTLNNVSNVSSWPTIDTADFFLLSYDGNYGELVKSVKCRNGENAKGVRQPCYNSQRNLNENSELSYHIRQHLSKADKTESPTLSSKFNSRCSALVRFATSDPLRPELYVGHTTWESFSEMIRLIKYYVFPFKGVQASAIAFSSYPGAITSTDDFIVTSSGLVVMETTIDLLDEGMLRVDSNIAMANQKLPDFMQPLAISRLASSAIEWGNLFQKNVNNFWRVASDQWMIVDYKEFERLKLYMNSVDGDEGRHVPQGLLCVIESIPGHIYGMDMTDHLINKGFWSSQNSAWFPVIRAALSGSSFQTYAGASKLYKVLANKISGKMEAMLSNPGLRGLSFTTLAPLVESLQDMKALMQLSIPSINKTHIPYGFSIAPRFDLDKVTSIPEGAVDSKIINSKLAQNLKFIALSGPEHTVDKPFSWVNSNGDELFNISQWPHYGQPLTWNFTWQSVESTGIRPLEQTNTLNINSTNLLDVLAAIPREDAISYILQHPF